jgi:glycosyltransferase involved in cell wall biosynthesis
LTVLQLISSQGFYGMENMLLELSGGLRRFGMRPVIGVFEDAREPHTEIADHAQSWGFTVEKIPCSGRLDLGAVKTIRNLILTYRADVIHSHGYKADIYAWSAAGRGQAMIATSHNWPSRRWNMRVYAALDRLLLRRFDAVAVISDPVARKLQRWGVKPEAIRSIPNGVDIERFRDAQPTLRSEIPGNCGTVVGCVGRAIPAKGGREFLEAARVVLERFPDTHFVWIGDGPALADWKASAAQLGIERSVGFTGARNDMPGVYASLDFVVLPSLEEAMPMCLIEAMAAGRPVVASDVGAVNRVVQSEITGLLAPPGDTFALAAAMMRLIGDRGLARAFGAAGLSRAMELFSIEATAQSYADLYQRAIGRQVRPVEAGVLESRAS